MIEPENKVQRRQWVGPGSPRPKGVQDTIICWQGDGHSILGRKRRDYVGLFTKEKYYANFLDQLRTAIYEKRRGKLSICVLLQQDNVRVHTYIVAMDAVERNGFEVIPHLAYSPALASSDLFLFPNL